MQGRKSKEVLSRDFKISRSIGNLYECALDP